MDAKKRLRSTPIVTICKRFGDKEFSILTLKMGVLLGGFFASKDYS